MIYFGMEPDPSLSAKMAMGAMVSIKSKPSRVIENKDNKECESEFKKSVLQARLGRGKGFSKEVSKNGIVRYRPQVFVNGEKHCLPRCNTEKEARRAYVSELAKHGIKADWHPLDD